MVGKLSKLGLLGAMLAIAVYAGEAQAQQKAPKGFISVKSGHAAGNPPTAQPSGNFTVNPATVAGDQYQVLVDFGTLLNGNFNVWQGPATITVGVVENVGASNYDWGPTAVTNLNNPPANLQVRAQLQWRFGVNGMW